MEFLDDVFSEIDDRKEDLHQFVTLLKKYLPDGSFQLVLNSGKSVSSGEKLDLSRESCDKLIDMAIKENGLIHHELHKTLLMHAMLIKELDATLIFVLPAQDPDSVLKNYGLSIVKLCVELFNSQKVHFEEQGLIKTQKRQINRKVKVLENKYNEILADNLTANEELREHSRLQQKILDTAATAILTTDAQGRITTVNQEFCSSTGYRTVRVRLISAFLKQAKSNKFSKSVAQYAQKMTASLSLSRMPAPSMICRAVLAVAWSRSSMLPT